MKTILSEYYEISTTKEYLNELKAADKNGDPFIVTGVIQRANAKNQNGRIYPRTILEKECKRYDSDYVSKGIALGELDHTSEAVVNLKNASHRIKKLWWEGDEVRGDIEILDTPAGQIAKKIVLAGIPLGISSRAIGSVTKSEAQGADVVQEDLQLVCFDLVCIPSTHGAFLKMSSESEQKVITGSQKVVSEGKERSEAYKILSDILNIKEEQ